LGGDGFLGVIDRCFVLPDGNGEEDTIAVGGRTLIGCLAYEAGAFGAKNKIYFEK